MEEESSFAQFTARAGKCIAAIGYEPLADEVSYKDAPLPEHLKHAQVVVPQDRKTDPIKLREETMRGLPKNVCVFVPGQAFDFSGTRHGRGGGWYDRFLLKTPEDWMLVGVSKKESVWTEPISKEPWDVPMDWVIVYDTKKRTWEAFETHARQPKVNV